MSTYTCAEAATRFLLLYCLNPFLFVLFALYDAVVHLLTRNRGEALPQSAEERVASLERHASKVTHVQAQVRAWNAGGRLGHMCSARPGWKSITTHPADKRNFTQIDISALDQIIELDTEQRILHVEPGMQMGQLTRVLLPLGWTVPVVPEIEKLTIGGLVCGAGLETSSHRYGLFADTCVEFELVLASGEVVHCRDEPSAAHGDLFSCIGVSHGTLGFLTAVKIPLVLAEPYVRLEYYAADSLTRIEQLLAKGFEEEVEFIEGFVYAPDKTIVMLGRFASEEERAQARAPVSRINRWYKPWFYKHVENKYCRPVTPGLKNDSQSSGGVEFIPTRDYYHRHSRSIFWEAATLIPYGNQAWFRYLFGWIYPFNYHLMNRLSPPGIVDLFLLKNHVVQDFVVPIDRLGPTLEFAHDLVAVYPVWLCPMLFLNRPGRARGPAPEMLIDIGLYGNTPKRAEYDPVRTTRAMERFVLESKGFQATYADIYMSREEFFQMLDFMKDEYYRMRAQYGAEDAFPDVYDKVSYQARRGRPNPSVEACANGNGTSLTSLNIE